jgi:hypothetical protein
MARGRIVDARTRSCDWWHALVDGGLKVVELRSADWLGWRGGGGGKARHTER